MAVRICGSLGFLIIVAVAMGACRGEKTAVPYRTPLSTMTNHPLTSPTVLPPTPTSPSVLATPSSATATQPSTGATATPTVTPCPSPTSPQVVCPLGAGLRLETAPILVAYREHAGLVMASSSKLAEVYFPQLEGWTRVLAAPSLAGLQQKADRAEQSGVPYEALGYGVETSKTTPVEEWTDLVGSTQDARALVDHYGKLLAMGPGFRLMSRNPDKYAPMAALADVWVLQSQRLQVNPPGSTYRQEVEKVITQIRSGNANVSIWVQITLPPDREPNAGEWLAYRQSIVDLVDGTYVGVYTWESADPDHLVATIQEIFAAVCGDEE
ncbi:MAG: hypothetical protein GTO49_07495 [Anaerolineae bacterium]|nr:hypothetical protein [Anaerolineae bacterium]